MIDLHAEKPLKRGIPGTPYYVELYGGHFTIKVRGSHKPGVDMNWLLLLMSREANIPGSAPAKTRNGLEYLRWIAQRIENKRERREAHKETA